MNGKHIFQVLSAHSADYGYSAWQKQLLDVFLLALRCYVAWVFFKSGLTKIMDWDSTLALFEAEYHVPLLPPMLAAVLGTLGELVFSVLLMTGFMGRLAALGLWVVNGVAVLSYPALFTYECPAAVHSHWYWGIILTSLVLFGVGRWSVDQWCAQRALK